MKKKIKLVLMIIVLSPLTACSSFNIQEINYDELNNKIDNKDTFILEVAATNCIYCKEFTPELKKATKDLGYKFYIIYVDKYSNYKEILDDLNVEGTPTTIFYNKGKETTKLSRLEGANFDSSNIKKHIEDLNLDFGK